MQSIESYPGSLPTKMPTDANAQFAALLQKFLADNQPAPAVPAPTATVPAAMTGELQAALDAVVVEEDALPVASPESEANLFNFSSLPEEKQKIARLEVFIELFNEMPTVNVTVGTQQVSIPSETAWLKKDALKAAGGGELYEALVAALAPLEAEYASKITKKNYMLILGY